MPKDLIIVEIKEKAKKNPGYLLPCNKERLEDMKRLKFTSGNDFTNWMQKNGIMKSPANIHRKMHENTVRNACCGTIKEYLDKCAKNAGFKDSAEKVKEWRHETGRNLPAEDNLDCPVYFGKFTEDLMIKTFEDPIKMPYGNPGFDWLCKNGDKIDNKGRCLYYNGSSNCFQWMFRIMYNNIADWFILSAWDNRDSLTPLHVWIFHKNDIVRGRKFCEFECFSITNTPEKLKKLRKYESINRLEKLKDVCNKII